MNVDLIFPKAKHFPECLSYSSTKLSDSPAEHDWVNTGVDKHHRSGEIEGQVYGVTTSYEHDQKRRTDKGKVTEKHKEPDYEHVED